MVVYTIIYLEMKSSILMGFSIIKHPAIGVWSSLRDAQKNRMPGLDTRLCLNKGCPPKKTQKHRGSSLSQGGAP